MDNEYENRISLIMPGYSLMFWFTLRHLIDKVKTYYIFLNTQRPESFLVSNICVYDFQGPLSVQGIKLLGGKVVGKKEKRSHLSFSSYGCNNYSQRVV